jgi:hypothetical protein
MTSRANRRQTTANTGQTLTNRRQMRISVICSLTLVILAMFGLIAVERQLPGMRSDAPDSVRYPVLPGESAWQQIPMPACQPTRLTIQLAQPVLAPGAISASFFVRDDLDKWPDAPSAIVRTTLIPGQSEVRLPYPSQANAQRRLIRLKLTPDPDGSAVAFRAARDTDHALQYVTKRPGYLGIESLVFRAEYPGERWLTPVACVTGLQFATLHPGALIAAILAVCGIAGWLCGVAWRLASAD